MRRTPSAVEFLVQAHAAAFSASGRLFELAATEALADQESVSANLARVEERLVEAVRLDERDRRAAAPASPSDESPASATSPQASSGGETTSPPSEGQASAGRRPSATDRAVHPVGRRDFSNEVWFAKLPAEVRRANRAQANRPLPRGYEQRLRRYFEGQEREDAAARDLTYPGSVTAPAQPD
jgi:hypothetical protein